MAEEHEEEEEDDIEEADLDTDGEGGESGPDNGNYSAASSSVVDGRLGRLEAQVASLVVQGKAADKTARKAATQLESMQVQLQALLDASATSQKQLASLIDFKGQNNSSSDHSPPGAHSPGSPGSGSRQQPGKGRRRRGSRGADESFESRRGRESEWTDQ
eukprot:COSAG05_NODE_8756_length_674_cov_1.325217_1_plen_159_part_10